ncbi:Matrix-remodeling-associated protein 7 [Oryzias melastigma]|uniref:Matrix-remodeling-associated protein 7 n=1 Tax=Oryzias melastigma TaxID=30732 RepID=A0A3B3BN28_ORYME|nr:uncharacterized protein LOC112154389 isoform X3 [Oryzias melastigma]KAF6719355.1 Matrix-remodeling-associated protein 7 [Oryzias melastigma]
MDVTFIVSAVIFTLLAIVVATSIFKGSSPAAEFANARSYFGHGGLAQSRPKQNGHVPEKKTKKEEADVWSEMSGSAHDHWDVVKSVLSDEQQQPNLHKDEGTEHSSSTSSLSVPCPGSRNMSFENHRATESPGVNERLDLDGNNSLKYVPGKARSHHLETMMSKEELEEEQRVQREQLAAIFKLLKDNKETFGDVSEGDLEEQLRLYSI